MSSLNNLVGVLDSTDAGELESLDNINNLICIDTSNQRLGINTLNPEYEIDVSNNGTIKTSKLIISNISTDTDELSVGQVYRDNTGNLKIKLN